MLISETFPSFRDRDGSPLDNGFIYFGSVNLDTLTSPIPVYWDSLLTQPALQPVRTLNGYFSRNGTISNLYCATNYSILVKNKESILVYSQSDSSEFDISGVLKKFGSQVIGYERPGTGVTRTIQEKLNETVSINDFLNIGIAAASNKSIHFPSGIYFITTDLDFNDCELVFDAGAKIVVSSGIKVIVRSQILAGDYEIFGPEGNIILTGKVNPMWFGAVRSKLNPGPVIAARNTKSFRRACKSFYSEYVEAVGTLAAPAGPQLPWEVEVPPGIFYFSNGFTSPVGVRVSGSNVGTLFCRLSSNFDSDTQIPLLTSGQSLAPAPGLAYQNDPGTGQSSSAFTGAGFAQTAAVAQNLYFVDQNSTQPAYSPKYPGCMFDSLFFTSCGIGIGIANTADMVGTNLIIDQGLTGFTFANCQNIRISNLILYNHVAQSVAIGANVVDTSIETHIEYPQGIAINITGRCQNLKFPNLTITQNSYVGTNAINVNANDVDVHFNDAVFRNLGNCAGLFMAGGMINSRVAMNGVTFDGARTNLAYSQNSNMQAISMSSGSLKLNNVSFRNLGLRSVFSGTCGVQVSGGDYESMSSAGSVFDFTGVSFGEVSIKGVNGNGVIPMLVNGEGNFVRVSITGCTNWLGAPFADGAYYSWLLPTSSAVTQMRATVSAQPDAALGVRKAATYIFERSNEEIPAPANVITGSKLHASPTTNGHPELTPDMVFASTNTPLRSPAVSQAVKLRVPIGYSFPAANVEYLI
jgi:hypothetical protein